LLGIERILPGAFSAGGSAAARLTTVKGSMIAAKATVFSPALKT
jgi:hypothetical protein